jgi:hypothetical protein
MRWEGLEKIATGLRPVIVEQLLAINGLETQYTDDH